MTHNLLRMLLHISGASHLLSTAESIHLCKGPVCAVGVCSWWLARVRIGKLQATHTQLTHSYCEVSALALCVLVITVVGVTPM